MSLIVIGIGDVKASNIPGSVLKTFALGSCIGVAILAPRPQTGTRPVAGLLHLALPDSSINQKLALEKPAYFADTGIPLLIKKMLDHGCQYSDLTIKIAGGANIMDPENRFNIGGRNAIAVKKLLWRYRLGAIAEDIGDSISRTMTVDLNAGRMTIASPGRGEWEL
jgi:chemotaxis protein CheD